MGEYGYNVELGIFTPYFLGHIESSYVSEELFKYKFAYGADLGVLTEFNHQWKLSSVFEGRAYPWKESQIKNELRYSNKSFGLGIFHQQHLVDGVQEMGLRFFKYL